MVHIGCCDNWSVSTLEHWVLCAHHGCCDNCALRDRCEPCESFHIADIVIIVQIVVVIEKFVVGVSIVVGCLTSNITLCDVQWFLVSIRLYEVHWTSLPLWTLWFVNVADTVSIVKIVVVIGKIVFMVNIVVGYWPSRITLCGVSWFFVSNYSVIWSTLRIYSFSVSLVLNSLSSIRL